MASNNYIPSLQQVSVENPGSPLIYYRNYNFSDLFETAIPPVDCAHAYLADVELSLLTYRIMSAVIKYDLSYYKVVNSHFRHVTSELVSKVHKWLTSEAIHAEVQSSNPRLRTEINFDRDLTPKDGRELTDSQCPIPGQTRVGNSKLRRRLVKIKRTVSELEDVFEKAKREQTLYSDPMRDQAVFETLRKFFTEKSPRTSSDFSSTWTQYFVKGDVNGTRVEALPNSGADMCFISPELASNLGLSPEVGTQKRVSLANKKPVKSPGMVNVPWKFAGEPETHILNCWIFPGCVNDLVLGNNFLKATQTLTNLANRMRRIKSKVVEFPRRLRLRLLGEEKQRLWGSLSGHRTAALPDTGSDVMLLSSAYAQQIGLTVDRDRKNLLEVEFADGTTAWTSGVVRNVPWTVGGETIRCDFHVLDDLCVDVILSNNYLFDLNVFSEHGDYFFDADSEEDFLQLCNIRLIGRYGDTLDGLEKEYLGDVTSPGAFGPAMIQRELARRDQIRDEILLLPENQREGATQAEAERQRRWQDLKQAHQRRWGTASNGHGSTQRTVAGRKTWWKKKVSISIPLRSLTKSTRP